jgi:hypothetical protein
MIDRKFKKYISRGKDTTEKPLTSHKPIDAELGPVYTLLGEEVMPDSAIRVTVRHFLGRKSNAGYPDYVDPHIHDVNQSYILLSEQPGNLEAVVTMGEEKYTLKSPAAAFIPAGVIHSIKVSKGHGFLISIMPMEGNYNEHTFPATKT